MEYTMIQLISRGLEFCSEIAKSGKNLTEKQPLPKKVRHTVFPEGFVLPKEEKKEE